MVNYMPFLVMALIGVDIYFKKKKSAILVISTFLMIMTSFYFSIGGMLALTVYAVYRYLELEKLQIKKFISAGLGYALRIITAVLMSCVLLIPTLLAISARGAEESTTKKISIIELLIPQPNVGKFAYNEYGIGLSILVIMVLLAGLFYKKISERALAYSLVITIFFPLIGCVLNGGLYVRSKVYIPFIPILLYEIALYLTKLKDNQIIIQISDNGKGIENVDMAKEPLYTTKPNLERSGMGFTIMESFMDSMKVESIVGLGTKVTLVKTIKKQEEQEEEGLSSLTKE